MDFDIAVRLITPMLVIISAIATVVVMKWRLDRLEVRVDDLDKRFQNGINAHLMEIKADMRVMQSNCLLTHKALDLRLERGREHE